MWFEQKNFFLASSFLFTCGINFLLFSIVLSEISNLFSKLFSQSINSPLYGQFLCLVNEIFEWCQDFSCYVFSKTFSQLFFSNFLKQDKQVKLSMH